MAIGIACKLTFTSFSSTWFVLSLERSGTVLNLFVLDISFSTNE